MSQYNRRSWTGQPTSQLVTYEQNPPICCCCQSSHSGCTCELQTLRQPPMFASPALIVLCQGTYPRLSLCASIYSCFSFSAHAARAAQLASTKRLLQKQVQAIVQRVNESMRLLPRRKLGAHELVFPFEVSTPPHLQVDSPT